MVSSNSLEAYKKQLEQETNNRQELEKQLQWVLNLSENLNKAHNEQEILNAVAPIAEDLEADSLSLAYIDVDEEGTPEWMENKASYQQHGEAPPNNMRFYLPEFPFAGLWEGLEEPLCISDFMTDERVDDATRDLVVNQFYTRAAVHVPLIHADVWIGILFCNWSQPHTFSQAEKETFQTTMRLLSATVGNRRLFLQQRELNKQLQTEMKERIETENALKHSQQRLQHLLTASPTIIYSNKIEGEQFIPQFVSENIEVKFGYSPQQILQKGSFWQEHLHPDDAARVFSELDALFKQGEHQHEYRFRFPDGSYHWIHDEVKLIRDEEGNPVEVIGSWLDITKQKLAEIEYKQAQKEIIEAQKTAIEELSTPIIPIMAGIIVMPLIGTIDSMRAADLMRSLLQGISQHRAKIVIMDITGVPMIDTGIAAHLDKTIQAARLKGARTIITGMSDGVAETLVDLGIDWSGVETLRDLQTGLVVALKRLGLALNG